MDHPIVIIGAGVAGLTAAIHLEQAGFQPLLLEAADRVGGRVKTEEKAGFKLDHGFQVLLTEYREARAYLDYEALDLRRFNTGAVILSGGRRYRIADPFRDFAQLPGMVFSPVGTIKDKLLVWQLTRQLRKASNEQLFETNGQSTLAYLQRFGFSERMIEQFFRPFFAGIFLEDELSTPAAMFRFVFRTFSLGDAAVPNAGMEAIPKQLAARLQQTTFQFHTEVARIEADAIHTAGGEAIPFRQVVVATDPYRLIPRLGGAGPAYHQTENLYFRADRSPLAEPSIALVAEPESPINTFCVMTDVAPGYAPEGEVLVSVTMKAKALEQSTDAAAIAGELRRVTRMPDLSLAFIDRFCISKALPALDALRYDLPATQFRITENIILAGDHLLNASLDAAMRSGRRAAEEVLNAG